MCYDCYVPGLPAEKCQACNAGAVPKAPRDRHEDDWAAWMARLSWTGFLGFAVLAVPLRLLSSAADLAAVMESLARWVHGGLLAMAVGALWTLRGSGRTRARVEAGIGLVLNALSMLPFFFFVFAARR